MGATGWKYFVPYEADISAALQRLHQDVFARGDYVSDDGLTEEKIQESMDRGRPQFEAHMKDMLARAEDPNTPEQFRAVCRKAAEELKKMVDYKGGAAPPKRKPKTIKALLKQRAESGTHSILDITCISAEPKFGAMSPFPRAKLSEFFQSETPSHAEIEEAYDSDAFEEFVSERWQGIYIIAYHEGKPSEIFFAGCSGD
jgi:hypothetical protein